MKQIPWYSFIFGLALVGGFAWFCYHLTEQSRLIDNGDGRYQWDRLLVIFNAIQTMAAAAVGALLGTTVQQARVQAAEQRAADKEEDAGKIAAARALVNGLQPPGGAPDPQVAAIQSILRR